MLLEGKTAVITGAGRGLGRAIALEMARESAGVCLISRTGEQLQQVADEVRGLGGRALAIEADVSQWDQISAAIDRAVEHFASINILVNNAAVIGPADFVMEATPDAWQQTIDINLNGGYHCCRLIVPIMKENNGGKIVNIVSGLGRMPYPRFAAYAASKSGLIQLTRSLAEELRQANIQVYGVDPGVMDTPMQAEIRNLDPEMIGPALHRRFVALKEEKQLRDPRKVARMVTVLTGSETDHLSGQIIHSSEYPEGRGLKK